MDELFKHLASLRDRPLGTIVVIGAGGGRAIDPARLAALSPKRLVLLEGDPENATELERRVAGLASAEVMVQAVAPQATTFAWQRYTVRGFNGPMDTTPLQAYYPRLAQTERLEVAAAPIGTLLKGLGLADHLNVLVFDVPGQEDHLVASIPGERLFLFEVVALRSCREPLHGGTSPPVSALSRLQKLAYQPLMRDEHSEPLWPLTLLRLDAQRHRILALERDLAAARAEQQSLQGRIAELESRQAQLVELARDAERRTAEHLQQVQQLTRNAERDAVRLVERGTELSEARAKAAALKESLEGLRSDSNEQRLALTRRAENAEAALQAAQTHVSALELQVRELEATQARQAVRQQVLQEEMNRAEGQIELVKGLLLGDAGL